MATKRVCDFPGCELPEHTRTRSIDGSISLLPTILIDRGSHHAAAGLCRRHLIRMLIMALRDVEIPPTLAEEDEI